LVCATNAIQRSDASSLKPSHKRPRIDVLVKALKLVGGDEELNVRDESLDHTQAFNAEFLSLIHDDDWIGRSHPPGNLRLIEKTAGRVACLVEITTEHICWREHSAPAMSHVAREAIYRHAGISAPQPRHFRELVGEASPRPMHERQGEHALVLSDWPGAKSRSYRLDQLVRLAGSGRTFKALERHR
jgi:hypothetical protein